MNTKYSIKRRKNSDQKYSNLKIPEFYEKVASLLHHAALQRPWRHTGTLTHPFTLGAAQILQNICHGCPPHRIHQGQLNLSGWVYGVHRANTEASWVGYTELTQTLCATGTKPLPSLNIAGEGATAFRRTKTRVTFIQCNWATRGWLPPHIAATRSSNLSRNTLYESHLYNWAPTRGWLPPHITAQELCFKTNYIFKT